ncbi:MAG: cobalamin B12-binding domain-containing protein [Calditrichaceae bacterium]|nr:cobalamin B12-binding domain-containing protein [Calditrichaceae bacterium]HES59603.1 cobalamin B12-binding domain-containing protein [Caldithrix sp.]
MAKKIRILIAKPGLDGHDRGAKYIARALKDAGYEVIYTGIRQSPQAICKSAIQEDVDFVGLSLLSGAHNELFPEVVSLIRKEGGDNIIIFGGGVIPNDDISYLKKKGIEAIFTPGTPIKDVINFIEANKSRISH